MFLVLSASFQTALAANIATSVERNPVRIDESFKIIFAADDNPDGEPDFTPLEHDFTVINQSQSSSSSWVNGSYSKAIQWIVEVTAKQPGKLVIPAIMFGKDTSEPLTVTVLENNKTNDVSSGSEEIILDVKVTPEQPYVQSQVIYTIRLYRRVELAQAELSEPELPDAVIEKLGDDSNFNTVINGVSYAVTERKYAIFPQKSGQFTIKPLTLAAAIVMDRPLDFRDFFSSHITKTKRILSKELTLTIKPAPPEFAGKEWLAAEKLELAQEWSGDIQQMKIGEPLTRTLIVRGEGTTVGQLPELNNTQQAMTGIKAYSDQPVLNESKQANGIHASREEKIALIPSKSGQQVLPAIEIPWFNTKTQKMEIARLPETTINVIGSAEAKPEAVAPAQNPVAQSAPQPGVRPVNAPPAPADNNDWWQNPWFWVSVVLALMWFCTLLFFLSRRTKNSAAADKAINSLSQEASLKQIINDLKIACAKNDALAAKNALLAWGKLKFAEDNLAAIASNCNARLREEILLINQVLYRQGQASWQGKELARVFNDNQAKSKKPTVDDAVLEPLHRL